MPVAAPYIHHLFLVMLSRIEEFPGKLLAGKRMQMSFAGNQTFALWSSFMPHRKKISTAVGNELYSVEVYPERFFEPFDPHRPFEKWAAVAVPAADDLPDGMESLHVPPGRYAVFTYRGLPSQAEGFYRAIFTEWLPQSGYRLAHRPHFALMGEKYKGESPDSEEEIWIPVEG